MSRWVQDASMLGQEYIPWSPKGWAEKALSRIREEASTPAIDLPTDTVVVRRKSETIIWD